MTTAHTNTSATSTPSQHTPGPWFKYISPHGLRHVLPCQEPTLNTVQICTFNGCSYRSPEETEANARLIAAAPDLLEAAKLAIARFNMLTFEGKNMPDDDLACDALIAAIAKTQG